MQVAGFQKLTLTDFPGLAATIVFTQGCNMKCPYCQNSELIPFCNPDKVTYLSQEENFKEYLHFRKKILDGVVITGGEPTMQKDLPDFARYIKNLGLKVKLDTNGTNPNMLKALISQGLLDYIAMDVKASMQNYALVSGISKNVDKSQIKAYDKNVKLVDFNNVESNFLQNNILKSIEIIKNSKVEHEFRTTIVKEYHSISEIINIIKLIGEEEKYYLQNFENSEYVIDHSLKGFSKDELLDMSKELKDYKNLKIRGIN